MGSPFYGTILQRASEAFEHDSQLRALLEAHDAPRIGLHLVYAAHFRALRGEPSLRAHFASTGGDGDAEAAWRAIHADIAHAPDAYDTLLARPVQTNEVARAMPLLAALLHVAARTRLPMRLFEAGSSAGLLLRLDRYAYAGDGWRWGDPNSPLELRNRTQGGAPANLDAPLSIVQRRGCDLNPLDAASAQDAAALLSFVWPDQPERFVRLQRAIEIARTLPVTIDRAAAQTWIENEVRPQESNVTVVMHSVMMEHLSEADRGALVAAVESAAQRATPPAPIAWVRMEVAEEGYETRATLWPPREETVIALSDGHAQNLRWDACAV